MIKVCACVSDFVHMNTRAVEIAHTRDVNRIISILHIRAPRRDQIPVHFIPNHLPEQIAHVMCDPSTSHLVEKA